MAAYAKQGKFWKMHDKLFDNQQALDPRRPREVRQGARPRRRATSRTRSTTRSTTPEINADSADGNKFGAHGTPTFFINGRPLSGAQPFDAFKKVIDEEIANADKRDQRRRQARQRLRRADRERQAVGGGARAPAAAAAGAGRSERRLQGSGRQLAGARRRRRPRSPSSSSRTSSARSARASSRPSSELEKDYGKDVRVVWKNNPLPFHQNAMPAAKAAMAAASPGQVLGDARQAVRQPAEPRPADLEKYAQELGLNMSKFKAALDDAQDRGGDQGRPGAGAAASARAARRPSSSTAARSAARSRSSSSRRSSTRSSRRPTRRSRSGVTPADLYAALTKDGKDKAEGAAPAAAAPAAGPARLRTPCITQLVGDAPVKGADAKHAKVTIVEWSDFQCPFCGRVEPTLDSGHEGVRQGRAHRVQAAAAAVPQQRARRRPRRRWRPRRRASSGRCTTCCSRTSRRSIARRWRSTRRRSASTSSKFKAALDSGKWKQKVDAEAAEGNKIGASGTPAFFINGKSVVGAQPFERSRRRSTRRSRTPTRTPHGDNYAQALRRPHEDGQDRGRRGRRRRPVRRRTPRSTRSTRATRRRWARRTRRCRSSSSRTSSARSAGAWCRR